MHYRQITYEVTLISSDHYKNSSVIVDLAMWQIPRSTERISSAYNVLQAYALPWRNTGIQDDDDDDDEDDYDDDNLRLISSPSG